MIFIRHMSCCDGLYDWIRYQIRLSACNPHTIGSIISRTSTGLWKKQLLHGMVS
jgi:hypothetical protein